MKQLTRFFPLFVAALAAGAYAQDTATLKHTPKVGDASRYKLEASMETSLGNGTFSATISGKIVSVAGNGDYTEEQTMNGKIHFGDTDNELPPSTSKETRNAAGKLIAIDAAGLDDARKTSQYRMDALQDFQSPEAAVKVGDTWTYTAKPSSETGNVGAKVEYKVESAEELMGHKVFKIHSTGAENGDGAATSDVLYWVDRTSGDLVKAEGSFKKALVAAELGPIDMKFTLTLLE
jgi:hypothetical protein